ESGVEFIEEATKAVGDLVEKFKDLDKTTQSAIDVLKEEGTVLQDLRDNIRDQKRELEALAEAHKAGLIEQSRYKEKNDELIHSMSENETLLKRLTTVEREKAQIDKEAEESLLKVTEALNQEAASAEKAALAE